MRSLTKVAVAVGVSALTLSACGSSSGDGTASAKEGGAEKVTIVSPADGATVQEPFMLKWDSTVPLGPPDSGKDHVHVYVDGNSNDYTVVGDTQFRIKDLSAGEHKVEIALQHADHTPVGPKSAITVTVAGGGSGSTSSDDSGGGGVGY